MLTDEYTDTDPAHVEPVQECLNGPLDLLVLRLALLEFKYALGNGCDNGIMPRLDLDQRLREGFVVGMNLRRPLHFQFRIRIVPAVCS